MNTNSATERFDGGRSSVAENWRTNARLVQTWERGVHSRRVSRWYSRVVFGSDTRKLQRHAAPLAAVPEGSVVLDVPSGGGILLRALQPGRNIRYVAADISPLMLARVRTAAAARSLDYVECLEADSAALPFEDGAFDLVVSFTGLHCMDDPHGAIREMIRVLKPGGQLRGSLVVKGERLFSDAFIALWQRRKIFANVVTAVTFSSWLNTPELVRTQVEVGGAVLRFACQKAPE